MKILIVKTSSMGDVIHALPALNDAYNNYPNAIFDWAVEPDFAEIPKFHKAINRVIEIPIRKYRKNIFRNLLNKNIYYAYKKLTQTKYDLIIDLQGLIKSSFVAKFAKLSKSGKRVGLDKQSIKEPIATIFYKKTFTVDKNQHAVDRNRELFAKALGYEIDKDKVEYGLNVDSLKSRQDHLINFNSLKNDYVIFFHGTTWDTKHWPKPYWVELAKMLSEKNINIYVTFIDNKQFKLVKELSIKSRNVNILPKLSISQAAKLIAGSLAVVGVDTGFCHLSAAIDKFTVSLFGPTDPNKTAPKGANQVALSSDMSCAPCLNKKCKYELNDAKVKNKIYPPCFESVFPKTVFASLTNYLKTIGR